MTTKISASALAESACLEKVLGKLESVKRIGLNRWKACCPGHDDREPSLSIREVEDGKVLLHCWAGCATAEIMAAIDLELRDLFPGQRKARHGPSRVAVEHEHLVYQIGLSVQMQGGFLSDDDQVRFNLAKQRLGVIQ